MTLQDKTRAEVVIGMTPEQDAFAIALKDPLRAAGATYFIDIPEKVERVFYHTEVDPELGGRGLATLLVREALNQTATKGLTVIPVCPMVKAYLEKHPDAAIHRNPRREDFDMIRRLG